MWKETHIGGIADEFTEKDLLVAVEGVDDQTQQLIDLRLERKRLGVRHSRSLYQNRKNQTNEREKEDEF